MRFKKSLGITLLAMTSLVYAATCPTVSTIQSNQLSSDWKFHDTETHQPLSKARANQYRKMIEAFTLAEWVSEKDQKKSEMRCYYRDASGSMMEAYLTHRGMRPIHSQYWYSVNTKSLCAAEHGLCRLRHI